MPHSLPIGGQYSPLLDDGSMLSWQRPDSYYPAGTRTFDQHAVQPFNANCYLQDQLTGGELAGQVHPSHSMPQLPELHGEPESTQQYHVLNEGFFDVAPMAESRSFSGMNFCNLWSDMSYLYPAEFIAQNQHVSRDETMMVPEFIPSHDSLLASWQDDMTGTQQYHTLEKLEGGFQLPHMFGTTFSFYQTPRLEKEHAYVSPNNPGHDLWPQELHVQSTSETGARPSKRKRENIEREYKRYCITKPKNTEGGFGVLNFSLESRACTSDRQDLADISRDEMKARRTTTACIRCRIGKLAVGVSDRTCHIGLLIYQSATPSTRHATHALSQVVAVSDKELRFHPLQARV